VSLAFGDEVRVTTAERTPDHVGKIGVVVGIGEDERSGASYAVSFPEDSHTAMFWEAELTVAVD
jgi:hypothetical protein